VEIFVGQYKEMDQLTSGVRNKQKVRLIRISMYKISAGIFYLN